jgi:serine/threonine protein kinase
MLTITCRCGKKYQIDDRFAGRRVKCRACGKRIALPLAQESATSASLPEMEGATPPPGAESAQRKDDLSPQPIVGDAAPHESPEAPLASAVGVSPVGAPSEGAHYLVIRPFAKGGMGKISIARDLLLKRNVALKELRDSAAENPGSRQRFVAEAEITGQLEHPGVVPVYALGIDDHGKPFYAMRFVEGPTLQQAIEHFHEAPTATGLRELLRPFVMACHTMAYAHDRGVIHRDLKPANIMLGKFGVTLVMDWGLAKPLATGDSPESTVGDVAQRQLAERPEVTARGRIMGTPAYMPPEQASGKVDELGPAADIYGLGAVLYQVLTGKPAYKGGSSAEIIEKVRAAPPPKPSRVGPSVPRALEAICLRAMARQAHDRYPSATALAEDVQHWLDDEPVSAYAEPRVEQVYRWSRKHKAAVVSGVVCLILLILVSAVAFAAIAWERAKTRAAERLADDYAQQAADATQLAHEKVVELNRVTEEARLAWAVAFEATQKIAKAREAENQAKDQVAQLQKELEAKGQDSQGLTKRLGVAQAELATAESRLKTETERANALTQRAQALEQEAVVLRREAAEYRTLAIKMTQLATALVHPQQPLTVLGNTPWEDLTEQEASAFDVTANDQSTPAVSSDRSQFTSGSQSLRVITQSGGSVCVSYPSSRNANWDLSQCDYLSLAFQSEDPNVTGLTVSIGRGSRWIQYQAAPEVVSSLPKSWPHLEIPLPGSSLWLRTDSANGLDVSHVDWIAIDLATSGPKLAFWLDDLAFGPDPRRPVREAIADPDRRAAEYVLAVKGTVTVWVSGQEVPVSKIAELPKEPFKVYGISLLQNQQVTDDGLRFISGARECRRVYMYASTISDKGLEHLKGMGSLLYLCLASTQVNGSGLKHLAGHKNLGEVQLSGARNFNDDGMRHIGTLSGLGYLRVDDTQVGDEGLKAIGGLKNLVALSIQHTTVTDEGLRFLKSFPRLTDLSIGGSLSGKGLVHLKGCSISNLLILQPRIDDSVPESLQAFPMLKVLTLDGVDLTATQAKGIAEIKGLTSLQIGFYWLSSSSVGVLQPGVLGHIAEHPGLEQLRLPNVRFADATECGLLGALKTLRELDLTTAVNVDPAAVQKLQVALPNCKIAVSPEVQNALDKMGNKKSLRE